ncbi:radial spoke head 10 homolog B [Lingula anatina]|uniref:Radial spoke head 10 homolog B n=1 Tax=Lingula anatina TaxID=7574 RepID=A0A1S3J1Z2_LINAN|nr:radial spoke head 10 homolog B [Lingula anatina]|eukprot:XP_013404281.1 radial spoke head 10 homolog B [Lingula anatina]
MATKGKGKGGREDKKSAKKSEEPPPIKETKEEETPEVLEETPIQVEEPPIVEEPPKEPTPEPAYDEPTLTELIVESYEGEKVRGLYEGEGECSFTGGHHYKGNFSSGLMHGRGIYTWADGVQYEGEFTNNQVTGKGTYRWPNKSSYEGDVVNGMRHGYGIFRVKSGTMNYAGDWCMGKRHGKGRMEYDPQGQSYYDGDWVNNIKHGWGIRQYPSGSVYQGMWFSNVRHGEGTMKWVDKDQMYLGQWEDGVQHGMGQHIWFLRRVGGSQYPLRNTYDGEFCKGLRHGYGTFYYANGAKYEGMWKDNMKHGQGKFTFKNGRIYEGRFEKDHIAEFPSFSLDGTCTPDLGQIRTRTPLPADNVSVHSNESKNTLGPSMALEIDHLLTEFTEFDREEEVNQVMYVIMRHMSSLRMIYNNYASLGYEESPDNTYIMNRMQFWRMMKDCKFHHHDITLMDMDRALVPDPRSSDLHNPYGKILIREYLNHLVTLGYLIYGEEHDGKGPVLAWCLSKLIADNILPNACSVGGNFYYEQRRAVNALVHMDRAYQVYNSICSPRKHTPHEPSMKMRQFLFMLKDYKLVNADLTPQNAINVLAADDPKVADPEGAYNLELEMCFLEFFEALIGCAQVYVTEAVVKDPSTPRPSTQLTQEQSMLSIPLSPGRAGSREQTEIDDGEEEEGEGSQHHKSPSPETAATPVAPRAVSSSGGTHKTGEGSHKLQEQQASNATASTSHSDHRPAVSQQESARNVPSEQGGLADTRKTMSFMSAHSHRTEEGEPPLMQSMVSVGVAHSDIGDEEDEEECEEVVEEEELDEDTRKYNFWTHQVHIFFMRKFFPAYENMSMLNHMIALKYADDGRRHYHPEEEKSTKSPLRSSPIES